MNKIEKLKLLAFEKSDFDGFLITNEANLLYFTGVPGISGLLIPKNGENTIYVYGVNYEQARAEGKNFEVEMVKRSENIMEKIAVQIKKHKTKKIASDTLTSEGYSNLTKRLREKAKIKIQNELVWELRKIKGEEELKLMRKAGELTSKGMKTVYEVLRAGMKEYEVAAEMEYAMRKNGSWGTAFETIIVSGVRSAFPHGGCTDREIRKGDLIVVDMGATYKYYRSDITRTISAGKPTEKQERIYKIVKTAQEKAFNAIKSNAKIRDVDASARKVIEKAGYGECFVHSLGHGIGLEVHEPPILNPESKGKLKVGNVITNEPGIYIVGFGGIRIEDTVVVQKGKAEKLTKGPYTLQAER